MDRGVEWWKQPSGHDLGFRVLQTTGLQGFRASDPLRVSQAPPSESISHDSEF